MAHKMFVLTAQCARRVCLISLVSLTTCAPHTGSLDDQALPETDEKPIEEEPTGDQNPHGGGASGENESDLDYCIVRPILAVKCLRCHGDPREFGAPMTLNHAATFQEPWGSANAPLYERVGEVIDNDFMPATWLKNVQPPVEPLTTNEKILLLRWIDAGAPSQSDGSECEE